MLAETIGSVFFTFLIFWVIGGLLFFSWLYYGLLINLVKRTLVTTKCTTLKSMRFAKSATFSAVNFSKVVLSETCMAALLLSPFLIPLAVTAITFYFG